MSKPETGERKDGGGLIRGAALAAGIALALVGAGMVALGPVLYRAGMLPFEAAMGGIGRWATTALAIGAAATLISLIAAVAGRKQRTAIMAILVLVAAGTGLGMLYGQSVMREALPPIHDVQTDWSYPVAFTIKALQQREGAGAASVRDDAVIPDGNGRWSGRSFAEAQEEAYDLAPLRVSALPPDATVAAANAAKRLGWTVLMSDPPGGQVEAVHQTFWYGLVSDIAVRVTPDGAGSRIDVRSTSRLAGGDTGRNAGQVKALLDEIALMLR